PPPAATATRPVPTNGFPPLTRAAPDGRGPGRSTATPQTGRGPSPLPPAPCARPDPTSTHPRAAPTPGSPLWSVTCPRAPAAQPASKCASAAHGQAPRDRRRRCPTPPPRSPATLLDPATDPLLPPAPPALATVG